MLQDTKKNVKIALIMEKEKVLLCTVILLMPKIKYRNS